MTLAGCPAGKVLVAPTVTTGVVPSIPSGPSSPHHSVAFHVNTSPAQGRHHRRPEACLDQFHQVEQ